ncbi:MAG: AAA family ATPase [Streptosporangiaceae bacterium]
MIIWLNGAFGSGKTTLTEELHRRLPDAVIFDPEHVGYVLTLAVPAPTGDFQDLPSWRHLVIAHALTLRRFHAATLIVPMTLVNRQYFDEIIGTLREAGEKVVHVFLDVPADILESRIRAQVVVPGDPERDESNRQFRLKNIGRCVAAAKEQPEDTVMLRSDLMDPSQLADAVLASTGG